MRDQEQAVSLVFLDRGQTASLGEMMELSDLHRQVLIFEASWRPYRYHTIKRSDVVRERFCVSATTYQKLLVEACAHPDALRIAPAVVRRQRGTPAPSTATVDWKSDQLSA